MRCVLHSGDVLQLGSLSGVRLHFRVPGAAFAPDSRELLATLTQIPLDTPQFSSSARPIEQLNWLLAAARRLNQGGAIEDTLDALLQMTLQLTGLERGFGLYPRVRPKSVRRGRPDAHGSRSPRRPDPA